MHLYHITPIINIDSIESRGLLPSMSQGRQNVIWVCEVDRLPWAMAHVAMKRRCLVSDLMVCKCALYEEELIRTRWRGVYQTRSVVLPISYQSTETWLTRVERAGW